MQTLEEIAAGIAGDCLGHHDSRLPALIADILAALRAERERCASLIERLARYEDDSPAGERAAEVFNDALDEGKSMNVALTAWNAEMAAAIRNQP